jgi:post-segregation antitoxin (ccd killing protein)
MLMSEVILTLPDDLAKEAKANGLLKSELIASLLKAEIRRRKINKLFLAADRLAELDEPLAEEEVQAEIVTTHKTRKSKGKRSNSTHCLALG